MLIGSIYRKPTYRRILTNDSLLHEEKSVKIRVDP